MVSWHSPPKAPEGRPHGSAGLCVSGNNLVLVTAHGVSWDFPAGRPEGDESWEDTLRREMMEEACAVVTEARLLGFTRGHCVAGHEDGLVLVRSIWLAQVRLLNWEPKFEIRERRCVPKDLALSKVSQGYAPVWERAFHEAGLN
ncbi:MAG: NUDIX domain-containing protein [Spirochaetia bacterium]|nr:NUDIX domain-containing protein [Spirochaetia bacterium]